MYESLRAWCKQPIVLMRAGKFLPSGERAPGEELHTLAYVVDDTKTITDKSGKLYQCRSYAYMLPDVQVLESDTVLLPGAQDSCEIRRLGGYYDGNGKLSIQVVYL